MCDDGAVRDVTVDSRECRGGGDPGRDWYTV